MDIRRPSFQNAAALVGNLAWLVLGLTFVATSNALRPSDASRDLLLAMMIVTVVVLQLPIGVVIVSRIRRGLPARQIVAPSVGVALRLLGAGWLAFVLRSLPPQP